MADEEDDSMSEGFSASEDEWKPDKKARGGESSDDDDSDFEDEPLAGVGSTTASSRKREPKSRSSSTSKQAASAKKRKPMGQSLRTKLYNKYRPPPKTISSPPSNNSPSASTSRTASKNARAPNDSSELCGNNSSSESSVEDYLVNPADLDLQSSFFDVHNSKKNSPVPNFDCNAGIANLSDSDSEDNNVSNVEEKRNDVNVFDFRNLLDNANSLERTKETIAKRAAEKSADNSTNSLESSFAVMDVNSLLALGENNENSSVGNGRRQQKHKEKESGESDCSSIGAQKLNKTKSTRIKRHTKTRPTSSVFDKESDESDWEDVADGGAGHDADASTTHSAQLNQTGNLEIRVEFPTKKRKDQKQQQDLELALRRKVNRDMKETFLLLHKVSLLCSFSRSFYYNRLLNNPKLMHAALKLLPSNNAYPPESGTEIKYFQSMVTWFKTAIKLTSPKLYPEKTPMKKHLIKTELLEQIERKEARCKQDMIFIFIVLLRGMGLQCRLIVNMQPLPLKPAQADLLTIKLKPPEPEKTTKHTKPIEQQEQPEEQKKPEPAEKSKKSSLHNEKVSKEESSTNEKSSRTQKGPKVVTKQAKETIKLEEVVASTSQRANLKKEQGSNETNIKSSKSSKNHKGSSAKNTDSVNRKSSSEDLHLLKEEKKPTLSRLKRPHPSTNVNSNDKTEKKQTISAQEKKKAISSESVESSDPKQSKKPALSKLKRTKTPVGVEEKNHVGEVSAEIRQTSMETAKPVIKVENEIGEVVATTETKGTRSPYTGRETRSRSRSTSPKVHISPAFMQSKKYKEILSPESQNKANNNTKSAKVKDQKVKISPKFLKTTRSSSRVLRSRQQPTAETNGNTLQIPQLDGGDDINDQQAGKKKTKRPQLQKLQKSRSKSDSDEDFEPSPSKRPKTAPVLPKVVTALRKDRRVVSTDDEAGGKESKRKATANDMWVEVWSDLEEQWICLDIFTVKLHSVEAIRKSASSNMAYVFAFQNDLSIKDVTARYCPNWANTVRKARVDKNWLDIAISPYFGKRTKRDIKEDQEMRRIHEEKPIPTSIADFKDHPLYVLERHLLKFQALYPPDAPPLGFIRSEPVYSRECVHLLHSREIWLKQARTVKLGEQPYKIVKARPKWDRLTQTVIKDQPLEIFGYWQTEQYVPPTAENGIVPRNAYGNVELFKACMLPKKTVHIKLPGLNRICKKLGIDCANAVIGFDFHQGACHPTFDGFVVCEEFADQVTAAWYQDQEDQERKEQEKYEARVYKNWRKLIRGLLIRERLKKKYDF